MSKRPVSIVTRKIFHNFSNDCRDRRAFEAGCEEQSNDSYRMIRVDGEHWDADMEYLRHWLLANGAEESDEYVFISICW